MKKNNAWRNINQQKKTCFAIYVQQFNYFYIQKYMSHLLSLVSIAKVIKTM